MLVHVNRQQGTRVVEEGGDIVLVGLGEHPLNPFLHQGPIRESHHIQADPWLPPTTNTEEAEQQQEEEEEHHHQDHHQWHESHETTCALLANLLFTSPSISFIISGSASLLFTARGDPTGHVQFVFTAGQQHDAAQPARRRVNISDLNNAISYSIMQDKDKHNAIS